MGHLAALDQIHVLARDVLALSERVDAAEREHEENAAFALVQLAEAEARVAELTEDLKDADTYRLTEDEWDKKWAGVPVAEEETT
jgi:hypothetical protein